MADDGLDGVVAAFDEDVGLEGADEFERRVLFEEDDGIDGGEGGHDAGAFALGHDGARGAFEAADGGVGVEAEHELRAEAAAVFEQRDVADVEEIEAAVGEDDGLAGGAPLGDAQLDALEVEDLFACGEAGAGRQGGDEFVVRRWAQCRLC